jgi:GT2 family glycosyltransferase
MFSIPVFGVLVLNRGDLLLRLFESIDVPVDKYVIVNNGHDTSVEKALEIIKDKYKNVRTHNSPKNTGVSGGWNWIQANHEAPWYFIAGNDVMFTPGDLEKMVSFISTGDNQFKYGMAFGNQGHNAFIWTQRAIKVAGTFDENFYPAYLEDCDYMHRMKLTGTPAMDVQGCNILHGEAPTWGSMTIYSNPRFHELNGITHGNGHRYYMSKWGGGHGAEKFLHPYNQADLTSADWVFSPEWRQLNDIWGV